VATDDGLFVLDSTTMKLIKIYTIKNGLPNNYIYALQADNQDRIWIASNQGISILNSKNENIINLTDHHGLQGMEFNTSSFEKDSKGNLFFGGTNGFNKIKPESIVMSKGSNKPIIYDIKIMNEPIKYKKDIPYVDTIITKSNRNYITIEFQTTDVKLQKNASYKYILKGMDEEWIKTANRSYVYYSNLPIGHYTFEVSSYNIDDSWSPSKKLTIIIIPLWYQTWWFRTLLALIIGGAIFLIARWRINQIKSQTSIEKDFQLRIKDLELDNLRYQMNPHFMFNALNSINKYIVENNTRVASDYLSKFSKLMRLILEHSKQKSISLKEELETLQLYLLIESNRFDNSFHYEINVDENIDNDEIRIPPLIIQPFVENAIWHGLSHKEGDRFIKVNIKEFDEQSICIEVMDNGIGRKKASELKSKTSTKNKSFGMEITKQRIQNASAKNMIHIEDLYHTNGLGSGTKIKIILNS
jgi:uncharacterized membrane-anchored protein YhcB (DUF1043 family)